MKRVNLQQEWENIINKFNSSKFYSYSKQQKERYFEFQLLLTAVERTKNIKERLLLEKCYIRLKNQFVI